MLKRPGEHAALGEATTEANTAEEAAVKTIEAAMLARQEAAHVSDHLESVTAEYNSATSRAKEKAAAAKKFVEGAETAEKAAEEAKEAVGKAHETVEAAKIGASNAVELAEAAKNAADTAQDEVYKATEEHEKAQSAARREEEEFKTAKKQLERANLNVDETKKQQVTASTNITKAEEKAMMKQEKASEASKRTYEACAIRDEAEEHLESATRAAEDIEGIWLERHMKKVRGLESEFKKASSAAAKAQSEEELAELASNEAQAAARKAHADLALRKKEAEDAVVACTNATEKVTSVTKAYEEAARDETVAKGRLEAAVKNLKAAQAKAKKTTVQRAEEELEAANQALQEAIQREKDKARLMHRAKDMMAGPVAESEVANATAQEKEEAMSLAGQSERDALTKEELAVLAIADFQAKMYVLVFEVYAARFHQPAFWSKEENEEKAEIAKNSRLAAGAKDVRTIATGKDRARNQQLSVVDKWILFKQSIEAGAGGIDLWSPRRLLYEADGEIVSGITMMVSGIIGLALDRGPPCAAKCRAEGNGLSQASVNQMATFTITSCSEQGVQFDDGGDTFNVVIRYSGLGRQNIRSKIVDNEDGLYSVSFKPSCAGRCTIQIMLVARDGSKVEELPGSPYTCVVSSFSGPPPNPTKCEVSGDALAKVVAQKPERFYISFKDALGQLTHACDLDVWVQPIGKHEYNSILTARGEGASEASEPNGKSLSDDESSGMDPVVTQLLAPGLPGQLENLVVGSRPLDVSSTPDIGSKQIARCAERLSMAPHFRMRPHMHAASPLPTRVPERAKPAMTC